MSKYCCFLCPSKDYSEKKIDDVCPTCGKQYGFPLFEAPKEIINENAKYIIDKPINRGFYGATFLVRLGKLNRPALLKLTPVEMYKFFNKDFEDECKAHNQAAENTEHIVKIEDYFDSPVIFGEREILCHIAILQYVDGTSLDSFIENNEEASPAVFSQIAIDLLKILGEFQDKNKYHNDLHEGNLLVQKYEDHSRRRDAICDSIKLFAIDLNSVADESLSGEYRYGDRQQIYLHINHMISVLKKRDKDLTKYFDMDYRLVETLESVANYMLPLVNFSRLPEIPELISMIKGAFEDGMSYSPWNQSLVFKSISEGYNAQTINKCYIPQLLEDPEGKWIGKISSAGPQLITGMRGCGKTMLLGALDFHARAYIEDYHNKDEVIKQLEEDNYVGIFASCNMIIPRPGKTDAERYFEKLFAVYCLDILRTARHLYEIDNGLVMSGYHKIIEMCSIM